MNACRFIAPHADYEATLRYDDEEYMPEHQRIVSRYWIDL
jgi:hypothetical protein